MLTFAQSEWDNWRRQYREGGKCWSKLRLRLRRRYGKIPYIQTWERHQKGGLHVNVCVRNKEIFELASANRWSWRRQVLEPHAIASGFGMRTWVEPLRQGTSGGMAGYLLKLADELVGAPAKSQVPYDAPAHFRRLRASPGLLPPVHQSIFSGQLNFFPIPDFLPENIQKL